MRKSFCNRIVKTMPLDFESLDYNCNLWWNHYNKCAITSLCKAKLKREDEKEIEWEIYQTGKREEEPQSKHCVLIFEPIAIYSHDIRIHCKRLSYTHHWVRVYPSLWSIKTTVLSISFSTSVHTMLLLLRFYQNLSSLWHLSLIHIWRCRRRG